MARHSSDEAKPSRGSVPKGSHIPGEKLPDLIIQVTRKMIIMGATSSRDWQPIHHDSDWARDQAGLPDIIMNNYTQAGWISQYLTSWTGPDARIGRLSFSMRSPLCPGDEASFSGEVKSRESAGGCDWLGIELVVKVGKRIATTASARLALPGQVEQCSPWTLSGARWQP